MSQEQHFILCRDEDVTGVSGTGIVAHGHTTDHGTAWVHWMGQWATNTEHPQGLASVTAIHCHGGKTRIVDCDLAESGLPVLPWGHGWWVFVRGSGPFGEDSWIYTKNADGSEPTWNARVGEPYLGELAEGDHLGALRIDGRQVVARDHISHWATLVSFMSKATKLWVTRCIAETGGDPAFVEVPLVPEPLLLTRA